MNIYDGTRDVPPHAKNRMMDTLEELAIEFILSNLSFFSPVIPHLPHRLRRIICSGAIERGFLSQHRTQQFFILDK